MTAKHPSVGIGILNYNGRHFLEVLLPQLATLTYANYTVYIIDNASTDDSLEFIQLNHPWVTLVNLDNNYGFAGGYNRGFGSMNEDYYLMMNSDVEVPSDFLEPLVKMMEGNKKIASCQPKLLALRNRKMYEHGGAAGGMIDFLGYPYCRGRLFETIEKDEGQYDEPATVFWTAGACSLIRRTAYWEIEGMYEYYFMHSEEIDLCWRFIAAGYVNMFCPNAYIYHLGGGSLSYQSPRKTYLNFRNNIVMCFRNSPWYVNLWLLPVRFVLDMVAALKFLVSQDVANSMAVLKAYGGFMVWLMRESNRFPRRTKSLPAISVVLKKSIVWLYYVAGKRQTGKL